MSRRTKEANKAISNAWQREKQLILAGKGTIKAAIRYIRERKGI